VKQTSSPHICLQNSTVEETSIIAIKLFHNRAKLRGQVDIDVKPFYPFTSGNRGSDNQPVKDCDFNSMLENVEYSVASRRLGRTITRGTLFVSLCTEGSAKGQEIPEDTSHDAPSPSSARLMDEASQAVQDAGDAVEKLWRPNVGKIDHLMSKGDAASSSLDVVLGYVDKIVKIGDTLTEVRDKVIWIFDNMTKTYRLTNTRKWLGVS
jgi:hypothetical protein